MFNVLKVITDDIYGGYTYENTPEFFGFTGGDEILTERKSLLGIGSNHTHIANLSSPYIDYFKMFLIPEEPNGFFSPASNQYIIDAENTFDILFTICKYTKEWREKYFGMPLTKRAYIPVPFSKKFICPSDEKTIPVYFTAHNRPSPILPYIFSAVEKFGGTIVDASRYGPITHNEKMKFNGQSKISITYGLLFLQVHHIDSIMSIPNWKYNEAFTNLDSFLIPQMKTRVHEAALSKSIILHKLDEWNIIEDWYIPNEDFIYFDDEKDLLEKINEINKNYEGYKYIAENAYNKFINNYTTEHFINKFILPNTKLGE